MAYFWCTDHKSVEDEHGCRAEVRLGPYATREQAEHGVDALHERNDRLDAEDRKWEDG